MGQGLNMSAEFMARILLLCVVVMLGVSACSGDKHSYLVSYIDEIKARKAGRIPALPEVKSYEPYTYIRDELRDPFKPTANEAIADNAAGSGLLPDMDRNKEPLEAFPLDALQFVGYLEQEGRIWAVITAPDSLVYRVEEGNYIGQNFGRITHLNETQITIQEVIPNGLGGWIDREATLKLAE